MTDEDIEAVRSRWGEQGQFEVDGMLRRPGRELDRVRFAIHLNPPSDEAIEREIERSKADTGSRIPALVGWPPFPETLIERHTDDLMCPSCKSKGIGMCGKCRARVSR